MESLIVIAVTLLVQTELYKILILRRMKVRVSQSEFLSTFCAADVNECIPAAVQRELSDQTTEICLAHKFPLIVS